MAVIARQVSAPLFGEMCHSSSTPTWNGSGRTALETPAGVATVAIANEASGATRYNQPPVSSSSRYRLPCSSCLGTRLWPRSRLRRGPRTWRLLGAVRTGDPYRDPYWPGGKRPAHRLWSLQGRGKSGTKQKRGYRACGSSTSRLCDGAETKKRPASSSSED